MQWVPSVEKNLIRSFFGVAPVLINEHHTHTHHTWRISNMCSLKAQTQQGDRRQTTYVNAGCVCASERYNMCPRTHMRHSHFSLAMQRRLYLHRCDVTIHACNVQGFPLAPWNSHVVSQVASRRIRPRRGAVIEKRRNLEKPTNCPPAVGGVSRGFATAEDPYP